ncbi:MAG TPA: rod shape-determining protein MreC [bacterium]|jgi:rod shape-determining protein MreC|nr:rod shape-determining protein MreC [bacterium]
MSERANPLRRWWPLLGAAAVAVSAWGGLRLLKRAQHYAQGGVQAVAAPLASRLRSVAGEAGPEDDEAGRMRQQLALLRLENASLRERLEREAPRDGHLVFPDQRLGKLQPCSLLFRDPATWFKGFSVDVGSRQSLRPEAGVLNAYGVVGKLVDVGALSSQVLLLSDPACRFSARLARTGLQCAVRGDGRSGCLLEYLGGQDDVRVGDQVETGPGSRSFPSGVPVGKVVRLARLEEGLRLQVEVEPAAPLDRLSGLYVWVGEPTP